MQRLQGRAQGWLDSLHSPQSSTPCAPTCCIGIDSSICILLFITVDVSTGRRRSQGCALDSPHARVEMRKCEGQEARYVGIARSSTATVAASIGESRDIHGKDVLDYLNRDARVHASSALCIELIRLG
jgi:hypothetical protein